MLHADETPVAQLDPGSGKTKRAYLWVYHSNVLETGPPLVVFDYQTSRAGRHAQNFLGEWTGHLMVDDYAGYKALFAGGVITTNGNPLRGWLKFNPETKAFVASAVPDGAFPMQVIVTIGGTRTTIVISERNE